MEAPTDISTPSAKRASLLNWGLAAGAVCLFFTQLPVLAVTAIGIGGALLGGWIGKKTIESSTESEATPAPTHVKQSVSAPTPSVEQEHTPTRAVPSSQHVTALQMMVIRPYLLPRERLAYLVGWLLA
jgi:hypothetical protein